MKLNIIFLFAFIHGFAQAKLMNLSCNQIRSFVDGHNSRRLQLAKGQVRGQPPAAGMKVMVWDDELAAKAGKWASKNHFSHNPNRSIGSQRFSTGENLYWYATTKQNYKLNIDSALKSWFDEHNHYTYGPLTRRDFTLSSNNQIGHYTQMAWANTMYIGCAISQYGIYMKEFLVVCNYGPGGNYLGEAPYKRSSGSNSLICGTNDCRNRFGDKCKTETT